MRKVDGVSLCYGRPEARKIFMVLSQLEDFKSMNKMLEIAYG